MLERYTGRKTLPVFEYRVQYFRSTKIPARIDLTNALVTHSGGQGACGSYEGEIGEWREGIEGVRRTEVLVPRGTGAVCLLLPETSHRRDTASAA